MVFVGFIGVALAFFALVIDGGEYFAKSRKAQNAADAGALAGAQQLCPADDAKRATCEDSARDKALEYAQADDNMPEGTPTVTLLTKDGAPVSSSNPYTKVRVQISADAPLFFADLLGVSSTKAVGACRADSPPSPGQCAIASAQQETKTQTKTWTTTTPSETKLFAFAKGGYGGGPCDSDIKITGNDNVFKGAIWSNENLDVPLRGNSADEVTVGTGCSPTNLGDDHFTNIAHREPIGWPVEPPALVRVGGVPCLPGGRVTTNTNPDLTWMATHPPGIYCSSSAVTLKVDLALVGYTWVAPTIATSSSSTSVPRLFSPAVGSKILFYAYGGRAGRCDTVINTNGPAGISFTGYMLAPNGGITITTQNTSSIEGFIEGLCLQITGNGTRFTGSGPPGPPVTETHTETVTVPGDVSVALEW